MGVLSSPKSCRQTRLLKDHSEVFLLSLLLMMVLGGCEGPPEEPGDQQKSDMTPSVQEIEGQKAAPLTISETPMLVLGGEATAADPPSINCKEPSAVPMAA